MRRFMTGGDWNVRPNDVDFLQPVFRRISIALAIAGILCLSMAFGNEPVANKDPSRCSGFEYTKTRTL